MNISPVINAIANKEYKLLQKTGKVPITDIDKTISKKLKSAFAWLEEQSESYDCVKIGKNSNPQYHQEVISFFNRQGTVLGKLYTENGDIVRLKTYEYPRHNRKIINVFIPSKTRDGKFIQSERNTQTQGFDTGKGKMIYTAFKNVKYFYNQEKLLFGEYLFRRLKTPEKLKEGALNDYVSLKLSAHSNGRYKLYNFKKSANVDIDRKGDKWLIARILEPQTYDGLIYMTKKLLKDKGLHKLNINIEVRKLRKMFGAFSPQDGKIVYDSSLMSLPWYQAVGTVSHEVEHAHQFSLIGRLGKGNTAYETKSAIMFQKNKLTKKESEEALKYAIASSDYSSAARADDVHLSRYYNNYLEIKAREQENKVKDEYIKSINSMFFDYYFS